MVFQFTPKMSILCVCICVSFYGVRKCFGSSSNYIWHSEGELLAFNELKWMSERRNSL